MIRFWLALITVVIFIQLTRCGESPEGCPIYCICNLRNNLNYANCSGKRLISANSAVPYGVQSLDLSYNDITVLENNCFQGYIHLINITIAHNAIHTIYLDVFVPLKRIRAIDLSYNRLETIDPRLFESNRKLHTLNLAGNKFLSLANEPFLRSKSLRMLCLANAQINVLLPMHYGKLPNLQKIDLSRNLIIIIDKFAAQVPRQLRTLNLNENNLNCDQTLEIAIENLKARNVEINYSNCQKFSKAIAAKGTKDVEQKFERLELVNEHRNVDRIKERIDEEDAGDSQEDLEDEIRRKVITGWHFPHSSDEKNEEDYFTDFDVHQYEESDHQKAVHINKTCQSWCYKNGWNKSLPKPNFNDGNDIGAKQYSDFDLLFAFICGIAVGIALTIFIGSCILCIWRCTSLKARSAQVEDPYDSHYAVVRQAPTPPLPAARQPVDTIRRQSLRESEPEPEPVVRPQPSRRRQRRHPSSQHSLVPHNQVARSSGNNFISQLFGRPARHQYYRAINENTATLIRRLSRSNLFNNRLSQHFGDRERNTTNTPPNTPDSPTVVDMPDINNESEELINATRTPHRRRPETPPPLYSDIVSKTCEQRN